MPGTCAVMSCLNNRLDQRKKGLNVILHSFPKGKDSESSAIRKQWVQSCRRINKFKFNADNARVCSDHFTPDDYERDLKHEFLNLPPRKKLKKTAVPTKNLGPESPKETRRSLRQRTERTSITDYKEIDSSSVASGSSDLDSPSTSEKLDNEDSIEVLTVVVTDENMCEDEESASQQAAYKVLYEKLLKKHTAFAASSRKTINRLKSSLAYYKKRTRTTSTSAEEM